MKEDMTKSVLLIFLFIVSNISWSYGRLCDKYANSIYQVKITYDSTVAYEFFTFQPGDLVQIIDNTENSFSPEGSSVSQPFSTQTGIWQCTSDNKIFIRTFAFAYQTIESES